LNGVGLPGALNARVAYTHLFQNYLIALDGTPKDHSVGEIGTAKDRFTAFLGYSSDRFDWGFTGTYIGPSCEDDATLSAFFDLPRCAIKVPSEFYLDTQMSFKAAEAFEFYIGVDNLLDNDAPKILTNTTFNTTGSDTAADVYDVFGRRYYAGVRLKF